MHTRAWVKHQNKNNNKFCNEVSQKSTNSVQCGSISGAKYPKGIRMKPDRPENKVEYTVGEDDKDVDIESEKTDDSSSESDDEDEKHPDDAESDSNSSSTDGSSDSSNSPQSRNTATVIPDDTSMCAACGQGPYRSMKLHLLHCIKMKYQCFLCKELFPTHKSLCEHYMPLHSCKICGQVFSHENAYHQHTCPKQGTSPLVLFCAESMPQACNICKSFFTTKKTLLSHVSQVHTSVVSTKVCIITSPSGLSSKKVSTANKVVLSPNVIDHVRNRKLNFGQIPMQPPVVSPAVRVKVEKDDSPAQPTTQPSGNISAPSLDPAPNVTDTTQSALISQPESSPTPTIMALFKHGSQDVALMKHMHASWRSKASYPCRQCGAILRQRSLIISHRYLHRGQRSHQCQCGRTFKHRLHLLRHCIQHAETVSYICVSCGETFIGAKLLAKHMRGKPQSNSISGRKWKSGVRKKCTKPFTCDCGQIFVRPSAYIWHQLQNRTQLKRLKKSVKW